MKYAITAATGHFGQNAVKVLADKVGKDKLVVIARDQAKADKLFPGFEIRQGNYDDQASMATALKGIDKVLFISSQPGGKVDRATQHRNVVNALKAAGVSFVAYTSFPDAQNSVSALAADHKLTEKLIKDAGIKHAFLRNNWYLEDEMVFLQNGAKDKPATYWAKGNAGWALESELAEAAVNVLTSDNPQEVYELAGPMHTYEDLGQALQQATGNHFDVKQVSKDDYTRSLVAAGFDEGTAAMFASFQDPIDNGSLNHPSDDLAKVLGRKPLPLVDAIKKVLKL